MALLLNEILMSATIIKVILLTVVVQIGCVSNRVSCSLDGLYENASALEVGIMMALFAFVPALFAIRSGQWIDSVGPKKPVLTGICIMTVAAALPLAFDVKTFGLWPLYAACTINGLGFMLVQMTNQQLVGHLSKVENRTNNFAFLAMGYSTANLSAPIASGYLIDHLGFQSAYGMALCSVVLGLTVFLVLIRSKLPDSWNRPKVVKPKGSFELMGIPHVRNVLIASSFMSMAWDLQSFMIPVYGTEIGLSASEVGWILGVFASATFFVRLFMPIIARHLSEWQTITCAFALGALSYALFPIFESFYLLCAVAFLLGMALGSSQPNVMSLIHSESPPGRTGEALGLRTMLINLCHTTLPIIFGGAGSVIGAGSVFYIVASLMGGVSVFTSRCQKQSQSRSVERVVNELEQERGKTEAK